MADQLHAVLLALDGETLLLPNSAVAEVASRERVQPIAHAPAWLLGTLDWSNRRVPVVRFELLNGMTLGEPTRRERVVVLQSVGVHVQNGLFAVVAQGYPHLITLNRPALQPAPMRETDRKDLVLSRVRIASQDAVIPDFEVVEADLARAMVFTASN